MPKFQEVVETVRKITPDAIVTYIGNDYPIAHKVAVEMGVDYWANSNAREDRSNWTTFQGQVGRALDKIAEEGDLIKVRKGERGPDGVSYNYSRYYLPATFERIAAEREVKVASQRAEQERYAKVCQQLCETLGVDSIETRHGEPRLTIGQWELLLGIDS